MIWGSWSLQQIEARFCCILFNFSGFGLLCLRHVQGNHSLLGVFLVFFLFEKRFASIRAWSLFDIFGLRVLIGIIEKEGVNVC